MISIIINLFFSLKCIYSFKKENYTSFLFFFFTLLSRGWGLLPYSEIIFDYDWINLITVCTLFILRKRNIRIFHESDEVSTMIKYLLGYFAIVCIISPLRSVCTPIEALMVFRFDLFYLLYFVFKSIPCSAVEKTIPILLKCTLLETIIYFLQFFGTTLWTPVEEQVGEYIRFANIPMFTFFFFLYFFSSKQKHKYQVFFVVLFIAIVIISQTRGLILGVLASIVYCLFSKKIFLQTKILAITGCSIFFLSSIVLYRFSSDGSTGGSFSEELYNVFILLSTNDYASYTSDVMHSDGTFLHRIAMIVERVNYLVNHGLDIIIGAGAYHELSPITRKLPIYIGSHAGEYITKVDTIDVALLSHLFRCGLIYILMYFVFLKKAIIRSRKFGYHLSSVTTCYLIVCIVTSFSSEMFFMAKSFSPALLLLAYVFNKNKQMSDLI